jgi:16S rRNA (uracil1498-N3)-methyltransferase
MSLVVHLVDSLTGITVGDVVTVDGDEGHHAVVVRRLALGERVVLTDGVGARITGSITALHKRAMEVTAEEVVTEAAPTPSFTVIQALPKGDRGELAVEMLTEIGVASIVPWASSRTIVSWKGERGVKPLARWRSTAREAGKQARRSWSPEVTALASTADVLTRVAAADLAVILHEEATGSLGDLAVPAGGEIVVVVGPEGGLTVEEVADLTAAGATAVRLGTEVLRTSTAGVAAVAALLARTSRWG